MRTMAEGPSTNGKLEKYASPENQGKPDILNLSNALEGVTDWFMLGFNLGIPPYILRKIEKDYQGNDRRKTETLDTWLQRTPSASWSDVVSALRQMGENFTADSVDQQYIGGVATSTPQISKQDSIRSRQDSCASTSSTVSDDVFTSESISVSPRPSSSTQRKRSISQESPIGCGCGKCTFFSFIESGCPKPITSASSFPYLDLSRLTCEQEEELGGILSLEFKEIVLKFEHVKSVVMRSLMRRGVTVDELLSHLTFLETFDPVKKEPKSPTSYTDVMNSNTIPKIFIALSHYLSFFNYDIIDHIINELGTEEDKQELQKYKDDFQLYAKRRIYECPQFGTESEKDQTGIFVKVDSHYDSYTVQELRGFRKRLSEILHISPVLSLLQVKEGCFQVMFQVPSFVQQKTFPLSCEQERALVAEGVIKLTCGNYEFVAKDSPRAEGGAEQQQTPEYGGYDCEFVTPPPKFLQTECPICMLKLREPMQTNCGHIFCTTCIERVQEEQCPVCKESKFTISPDRRLQKMLNKLQVQCTHQNSRCGWTGELGILDRHLREQHQKQTEEQQKQLQKLPVKPAGEVKQLQDSNSSELPLVSKSEPSSPQLLVNHHFMMKKFELHKRYNSEWYSDRDPFYTHPQGYKLCVRIDANGYEKRRGTHVSLYICLMKGEYDHMLSWPFYGEITVELLNQNAGNSTEGMHHKCTICYDDSSRNCGQRVEVGEKRIAGVGEPEFIHHSELDPDQNSTVQYLKDDCLEFRVSVLRVGLPASHRSTKQLDLSDYAVPLETESV